MATEQTTPQTRKSTATVERHRNNRNAVVYLYVHCARQELGQSLFYTELGDGCQDEYKFAHYVG